MLARRIIMLRPAHFGYNPETARNNAFQQEPDTDTRELRRKALAEFDGLVKELKDALIPVDVWEEELTIHKTYDAVFLNNWFSTHPDNTVITYPMYSPYRRLERKEDYLKQLDNKYRVWTTISLEKYEDVNFFLESTGSMVIDHANRIVYGNRSPRTSEILFVKWARMMGFIPVLFDAVDRNGIPVYHTNVLMGLGDDFVIINREAVSHRYWRVLEFYFRDTGKEVIEINHEQMESFAGNVLPVLNSNNEKRLIMSERAYRALTTSQIDQIQAHARIVYHNISTIETVGGGSVRCMMAENYLQERGKSLK